MRNTTFGKENFTRNQNRRPSLTIGFWTAQNGLSYIGSTFNFIMGDELNRRVLFLKELKPPHTSQNIQTLVEDCLESYKIKPFKLITDNAANMKKALE